MMMIKILFRKMKKKKNPTDMICVKIYINQKVIIILQIIMVVGTGHYMPAVWRVEYEDGTKG